MTGFSRQRRSGGEAGGRPGSRPRISAGFTLLEVLFALALVGLLLVALNTFIFSMGELWGRGSEARLFDQHVRNVSRFLERELRAAVLPPSASAEVATIAAKEVRSPSGFTEPMVTFELREGTRLIAWPGAPLPEVVCSLQVRSGIGLVLLWQSRIESRFGEDLPRETLISPWVAEISYEYYEPDFKSWRTEQQLRRSSQGQGYDTPQRMRLTFRYGTQTRESVITVPAISEGLPVF